MKRTQVAFYGSSLYMAGIMASLKTNPAFEVVCIDPASPGARQALIELTPAAIVLDLDETPPDLAISLLRRQAGLLLIGFNPAKEEMLALSSRPVQGVTMVDLAQMLMTGALPA